MKKFIQNLTKRFNKDEKGFTLIELIIVIAILAVIVAIAVPNIMGAVNNSRKTADVSNAKILADAVATVRATYDEYANVSETFTVDSSGVDDGDATSDYDTKVQGQLQHVPVPKYNGETEFTVRVRSNGEIMVYAGSGTSDAKKQLYPVIGDDYIND